MQASDERRHVLVVDDHAEMGEVVAEELGLRGYEGVAISSGPVALAYLRSHRVDGLVTDLRMPGVDGLTLLRASMALDPSRPVILMTAYGSLSSAVEAVEAGSWQYLLKPFRIADLARLLAQAFELRP